MCRMRSIKEVAQYFKDMDSSTQITEKTIRTMIANDSIPYVKTGVKYLLNLDLLLDMFSGNSVNGLSKLESSMLDVVVNK